MAMDYIRGIGLLNRLTAVICYTYTFGGKRMSELEQIEFAIEQTKTAYLLGTGGMKEILRKLNERKDALMGVGV